MRTPAAATHGKVAGDVVDFSVKAGQIECRIVAFRDIADTHACASAKRDNGLSMGVGVSKQCRQVIDRAGLFDACRRHSVYCVVEFGLVKQ